MRDAPILIADLETKILDPLLVATGMNAEEKLIVKKQLMSLIINESVQKVWLALSKDRQAQLVGELFAKDKHNQFEHLQLFISQDSDSRELLSLYLQRDVPQLIAKLLTLFMDKATPKQKQKFIDATELVSAK